MRKRARLVGLAATGGVAAVVVAWLVLRGRASDDIRIETAVVTTGTIARQVMVTGTLQPERAVNVGSQVSGTIAALAADFNSMVRAGQVLARLDPSMYEARLMEAQARVEQAEGERARLRAVLDDARLKLARAEDVAAEALMTRAELDLARTTAKQAAADVRAADAAVAAARATVTEARISLDHTTIRSPIDGIVVGKFVEVGQTLAASVQTPVLFTIADLRRMQLLAEVAEADVGGVRPGSVVRFEVESIPHRSFEGTVAAVRLQPILEQAAASSSGASSTSSSPIGTSGISVPTTASPTAGNASTPPPSGVPASANASPQAPARGSSLSGVTSTATATLRSTASKIGVVTYIAVVNVTNADGAVPPGGTAIVTLNGPRRPDVVRLPNNALTFHPSAEAFAAVRQQAPIQNRSAAPSGRSPRNGIRQASVWKFVDGQFVPVRVETGLADDSWTELVSGAVDAGDVLVTSAVLSGR